MTEPAAIAEVRRFNRTVTECIGALHDEYLSRGRSLGASRVLWEIGVDGCEVRALRRRLGLDSGYLSRLLRSLEVDGLVDVVPSPSDRRVRTARLTPRGRREHAELDRRSDALASSMLDALDRRRRARLVEAMTDVERILASTLVEIEPVDPAAPEAQHCLREYYAELDRRFPAGFDPERSLQVALDETRPPAGVFLLAARRGKPAGCGALKLHGSQPAEVKRMWVAPAVRGVGLARRLLRALEERARAAGAAAVRLDTNGTLVEAIALYRSEGYREIAPFNAEPYADHWFEKRLP
jgi:DNA-binding MarR family transcriptional regulator